MSLWNASFAFLSNTTTLVFFCNGYVLTPISLNFVHVHIFHLILFTFLKTQMKSFNSGLLNVICYSLNMKCSPEAHMFQHLLLSVGASGKIRVPSGGGTLMEDIGHCGQGWRFYCPNSLLFRLLLKWRCDMTHNLLLLPSCFSQHSRLFPLICKLKWILSPTSYFLSILCNSTDYKNWRR